MIYKNINNSKKDNWAAFENILLAISLAVMALRSTLTESPATQSISRMLNLGTNVYSLAMSGVLIGLLVIWVIAQLTRDNFSWRVTGMGWGIVLLCMGASIAGVFASNKRAAVTDAVVLISPLLMSLLIVQLLKTRGRIMLVLCILGAIGIVQTFQGIEQLTVENKVRVEQYQKDPIESLIALGIEPGSFEQMLFEHRIHSGGMRGYFTTANSAGSFLIMAMLAGAALFMEKYGRVNRTSIIITAAALAFIATGLVLTSSKGAMLAGFAVSVMFVIWLKFSNQLFTHRKLLLIFFFISLALVISVVTWYGLRHETLPGNSLLVRWQYWVGAVKMFAQHPLGVGAGNFGTFYTHFKPAAALETVSDPHNLILSLLTQYGPIGLIGFFMAVTVPLLKAVVREDKARTLKPDTGNKLLYSLAISLTCAAMLIIRPILTHLSYVPDPAVMMMVIMSLFIAPVLTFLIGFWFVSKDVYSVNGYPSQRSYVTAAMFCAAVGVLLHGLIDYAIFEPPVFTTFCMILAVLVAEYINGKEDAEVVLNPVTGKALAFIAVTIFAGYLFFVLIPPAKSTYLTLSAMRNPQISEQLLESAATADTLDSEPLLTLSAIKTQKAMQQYSDAYIKEAAHILQKAASRNPDDYKAYERLIDIYILSGDIQKAVESARLAVERYPMIGRLRLSLAKIEEQAGSTDAALENYRKAVWIEDAYREQFKRMYPGREVFSRIGEDNYRFAIEKISELSSN